MVQKPLLRATRPLGIDLILNRSDGLESVKEGDLCRLKRTGQPSQTTDPSRPVDLNADQLPAKASGFDFDSWEKVRHAQKISDQGRAQSLATNGYGPSNA
jgi:hypothetical protein